MRPRAMTFRKLMSGKDGRSDACSLDGLLPFFRPDSFALEWIWIKWPGIGKL